MELSSKTLPNRVYICPDCNESFKLKATLKSHIASKHKHKRTHHVGRDVVPQSFIKVSLYAPEIQSLSSINSRSTIDDDGSKYNGYAHNIHVGLPKEHANVSSKYGNINSNETLNNASISVITLDEDTGNETDPPISPINDTSGYETDKTLIPKTFFCALCKKSFDVETRYTQHMKSEGHKQKMKLLNADKEDDELILAFCCDFEGCDRKFETEVQLLQHQEMKHKSKDVKISGTEELTEFQCSNEDCNKAFSTKAQLLQHVKDKHSAGKNDSSVVRQLCTKCDEFNEEARSKPFIFLTYVAKHILTNHEKDGYIKGTCPICGARVDKQKNLLTHISRTHLFHKFKDEACSICLRLCKNKEDLLQHSTTVHRFSCAIDSCHSMFPSKLLRDNHMLDKHSVYGCGYENCQQIFSTLEEKINHMKLPHVGEVSEHVIGCLRSLANVHEGGAMSEPVTVHLSRTHSPTPHVTHSADEAAMRSNDGSYNDVLRTHRVLLEKAEDLTAFINEFSGLLSRETDPCRSKDTFETCDKLKHAIEGVQRRLTPRVD